MNKSLHGLRILNTRPQHQAQELSASIRQAQGKVIECPCLEIEATNHSWVKELPDLNQVHSIIFISANAVHQALSVFKNTNTHIPENAKVIAIGQATANALAHYQIPVTAIPTNPDSQHVLALPCLQNLNQQTVLLFKGEGGLELISKGLQERGAKVIALDVYRRTLPKLDPEFVASIWRTDRVNIILATSEQSLRNIFTLFGHEATQWLQSKTFIVLSSRVAEYASSLGIKKIKISHPEKIVQTLHEYLEEQSMSEEQKEPVPTNAAPKSNLMLTLLCLLGALIAIGIAVYSMQQYQKIQTSLQEDNKNLSQQIKQLQTNSAQTQTQFDTREEKLTQLQETMHAKISSLNQEVQNSLNQLYYKNEDWLLLKARYYIELAQINAHWSNDFNTAIALLEQADSVLEQMSDTKIFEIRQALATEIAELKAIPTLDTVGILTQLDAAQASLNALTVTQVGEEIKKVNPEMNEPAASGWRGHLQSSFNLLSKMVIVRRHDEPIKPLISAEYEAMIKENIRLNLQEAQWAVLSKNTKVFHLVLDQAINTIQRTYNTNGTNTEVLINQLKQLQQINVTPEQPQIGKALPLINQVLQSSAKTPASNLKKPAKPEGAKQ